MKFHNSNYFYHKIKDVLEQEFGILGQKSQLSDNFVYFILNFY